MSATNTAGRHPAVEQVLRFFEFEHLRAGELRDTSQMFHALAHELADRLPADPETTVALRKLLESKDCAVRASLALVTGDRREALDRRPVEPASPATVRPSE